MEEILEKILVVGGKATSLEIINVAHSILPGKTLTHDEVKDYIAKKFRDVTIKNTYGGINGSQIKNWTFYNVSLISGNELASTAELCLVSILDEEFEAADRG